MHPENNIDTAEKFEALLTQGRDTAVRTLVAERYINGESSATYDDLCALHLKLVPPHADWTDDELVAEFREALEAYADFEDDEDD